MCVTLCNKHFHTQQKWFLHSFLDVGWTWNVDHRQQLEAATKCSHDTRLEHKITNGLYFSLSGRKTPQNQSFNEHLEEKGAKQTERVDQDVWIHRDCDDAANFTETQRWACSAKASNVGFSDGENLIYGSL